MGQGKVGNYWSRGLATNMMMEEEEEEAGYYGTRKRGNGLAETGDIIPALAWPALCARKCRAGPGRADRLH